MGKTQFRSEMKLRNNFTQRKFRENGIYNLGADRWVIPDFVRNGNYFIPICCLRLGSIYWIIDYIRYVGGTEVQQANERSRTTEYSSRDLEGTHSLQISEPGDKTHMFIKRMVSRLSA